MKCRNELRITCIIRQFYFLYVCLFVCFNRVSLCSPALPGSHCVLNVGLQLAVILLSQPSKSLGVCAAIPSFEFILL